MIEISLKNQFHKGDTLPITVDGDMVILHSAKSGNSLDITQAIPKDEFQYIKRVGKGIAIIKDNQTIFLSYCFNYHTHSQYSILDGMSSLKGIAKKSSGITAVTDHGNMFNILKWQNAMNKEGKKPVFGFEAYVEDVLTGEKTGSHGLFLIKNEIGKNNAFQLSSLAYDNFYKKPHVSLTDLKKYHDGLIFTSACIGGELAKVIVTDYEKAKEVASFYKQLFGDDYYIEIQRHGFALESKVNPLLIQLAKELGIKIVGANDSHYLEESDEKEHKILLAVSYGKMLEEVQGFDGTGYHYKTDKEMVNDFWDFPEAISNTIDMAQKCDCTIPTGIYHMPNFPIPEPFKDSNDYLLYLIDQGFKERYQGTPLENNKEYLDRLNYEKSIVISMGFSSYFLIVWDYVNWARNNGILVGPGRGSGAGSLCLYCLKITDIDPIKYGLKFERFLNPDRVSMPDIDMDFEDSRRQEVIEYVRSKYGAENVCNIITFGSMMAKNAIRDICRVKGESYLANDICKAINPKASSLSDSLNGDNKSPELIEAMETNSTIKDIIESALKLEGNPRQTSTHACGIVVSDAPIRNYLPTAMVKDSKSDDKDAKVLSTQVTMTEVEELGLLKMDFLGLKTLSVIGNSLTVVNKIRKSQGFKEIGYYMDIPLNDPYVYADISKGLSYATFQIESEGMRSFIKELFADVNSRIFAIEETYSFHGFGDKISGSGTDKNGYINAMTTFGEELFERMIAGVALYRPGPMDYIPDYIENMNNPDKIVYDTPLLENVLKNTYGVIVYQEQVIDIVKVLAGFTAGQADTIRRAMGKKKQAILDEYKPYFIYGSKDAVDSHSGNRLGIKGCIDNNIPKETAEAVWDKMADFAKYAFNKSHAAAYAVLTIICAWLKYYYPAPYMSSVLNVYMDDNNKFKTYISDTKKMGLSIIPPDINISSEQFKTNGKDILFGLKGLNGISKTVREIVEERKEHGPYLSIQDFIARTYPKGVSKKSIESLIYSGCFDCFGYSRKALINSLDNLMEKGKELKKRDKQRNEDQLSFFDEIGVDENHIDLEIPHLEEYQEREKLRLEFEAANIYISAHPLDGYNNKLADIGTSEITSIWAENDTVNDGKYTFAGLILDSRSFYTKKGDRMATFTLSDRSGEIKCTVFSKDYESAKIYLDNDSSLVVVKGEVKNDDKYGVQMIANSIVDIDRIPDTQNYSRVFIRLDNISEDFYDLAKLLRMYSGDIPVFVQSKGMLYDTKTTVSPSSSLFMALSSKYGYENIKFK